MPKSYNQKMKILYLMRAFLEETDEEHVLSMNVIIEMLSGYGIKAERKSVYDDIEALRMFGMDIILRREQPLGYYLASRDFELSDMKLMASAIQSSRFLTSKKTTQLTKKMESLLSKYDAGQLQMQVHVPERIKTMNESIYFSVDKIQQAIAENAKISFQYFEWTINKEMRYQKDGKVFRISPWAISWDGGSYYVAGYDDDAKEMKYYRLDKMYGVSLLKEDREGKSAFREFNLDTCSQASFGLDEGKQADVEMEIENERISAVFDRFGKDTLIIKKDDKHFTTRVKVKAGPAFFGWLTSMGIGARIVGPSTVKSAYSEFLEQIKSQYR